jgi:AmmeMemoRadiSam system protein B
MIRKPVVAGAFYPADKNTLINQINIFLNKAKKIKVKGFLKILIVPHAGYDYSGQTAAWGFKQLKKQNYSRVIILGISHRSYFSYAAVYHQGAWQTPLGKVEIDEALVHNFLAKVDLKPHQEEHSLEVELPFLQRILKDFKIVPILLSQTTPRLLENLAAAIVSRLNQKTLLVISSDLSHYPSYKIANKVDRKTINSILTGKPERFNRIIQTGLDQPGVETCACGAEAIKVGMMVAKKLGIKKIKLLNYSNSGDRGGDKNQVVGYASIGFYESIKL